jgi:dGTPase
VVKHNGPLAGPGADLKRQARGVPPTIAGYSNAHAELELDGWPGLEAQIAALSDDIAYNNHDIDDGLRAGLFTVADLAEVPLVGPVFANVAAMYPGLEETRLIHESIRRLIDRMVSDLLEETRRRLAQASPATVDDIRRLGRPVAAFSAPMREHNQALKAFLFDRMYRHYKVNRMTSKARTVVSELFDAYLARPDCLPDDWRRPVEAAQSAQTARLVADYIAGMTDRFALEEHRRLFDPYAP